MIAVLVEVISTLTTTMPKQYLIWLSWIAILITALWLRIGGLEDRPIHADEATGAHILGKRLNGEAYNYNPKHFHGPVLSMGSLAISMFQNERSWEELTLVGLRTSTVIAGILLVLVPLLWTKLIDPIAAIVAGAFLATSPLLVYYSRMYIHEVWLTLFGMIACWAIYRISLKPTLTKGAVAGLFIGLMFATKATTAISIIAWVVAFSTVILIDRSVKSPNAGSWLVLDFIKPILVCTCVALATTWLLVSNFFQNPSAILDTVKTYFVYETTNGHEKPASYFIRLLIWPKHSLGTWWSEAMVLVLAIVATLLSIRKRNKQKLALFLVISTVLHFLIYSLIGYKTPWLSLLPWAHLCLLAGFFGTEIFQARNIVLRLSLIVLISAALGYQIRQSLAATRAFSNDIRNPYAYVPTTKDVGKLAKWFSELSEVDEKIDLSPIAVVGQGYWPLPWYLRDFEVGYWTNSNVVDITFPVVIAMSDHIKSCDKTLGESHVALPRSLRNNVPITVYLRNDIWSKWMKSPGS
ncbi:MAG: flippase activity-associated protein Agl23 [Verrucomicrobiota bacterium]